MTRFTLKPEEICKAKFKPWFDAGGWTVHDLTRAKSANFQIPEILANIKNPSDKAFLEPALYAYVKSVEMPHDGEAVRGRFMFCFDYKYHAITKYGLAIRKAAYDKYWSWKKPWFYVLQWAADRDKGYIHQIRDPVKAGYRVTHYGGHPYYNVEQDCVEAGPIPNIPVVIPDDLSSIDSLAWNIALNRWVESDFRGKYEPTAEERSKAVELLSSPYPKGNIRLRRWKLSPLGRSKVAVRELLKKVEDMVKARRLN